MGVKQTGMENVRLSVFGFLIGMSVGFAVMTYILDKSRDFVSRRIL